MRERLNPNTTSTTSGETDYVYTYQEEQAEFRKASINERKYILKFIAKYNINQYLFPSINSSESYDVIFGLNNVLYYAEFKVRDYKSTDFQSWFFEKKKFDRMNMYKAQGSTAKMLYINFYSDNTFRVWDVTNKKEEDFDWKFQDLPINSVIPNSGTQKKLVTNLLNTDSKLREI